MTEALLRLRSQRPVMRLRRVLGLSIVLGGLGVSVQMLLGAAAASSLLGGLLAAQPVQASALAGLATGLGALGVLVLRRGADPRGLRVFMALSAGMMAAAAMLSLVVPAIQRASMPAGLDVLVAAVLGYKLMALLDRAVPHRHPVPVPGSDPASADTVHALRLMVVAIAAHNLPEGFAVAAGFGGGSALGWGTTLSIALQNVPEGLVVGMALWSIGLSRGSALLLAAATGLLEPVGAVFGFMAVGGASESGLSWALALAGGAMLFVVVDELVPEALRSLPLRAVALWFILGLMAMATVLAAV